MPVDPDRFVFHLPPDDRQRVYDLQSMNEYPSLAETIRRAIRETYDRAISRATRHDAMRGTQRDD